MYGENINRGLQQGSDDNGYFIVGERANTLGIGEYKCKPNITDDKKIHFVLLLEVSSLTWIPLLYPLDGIWN